MKSALPLAISLTLASFAGCVTFEDGLHLPVRLAASPDGPLSSVWLGDGTELVLDDVVVTVEMVELVRCGATGGHVHHTAFISPFFAPSTALAQHQHGSPLMIHGPFVVHLGEEATDLPAALSPAPGCYDHVIATLSSLVLGARMGETYLSATSRRSFDAHVALEEPLQFTGEPSVLEVSLVEAEPFALLPAMPTGGVLDGDTLLAGLSAQTGARVVGDLPPQD